MMRFIRRLVFHMKVAWFYRHKPMIARRFIRRAFESPSGDDA